MTTLHRLLAAANTVDTPEFPTSVILGTILAVLAILEGALWVAGFG